MDGGALRDGLGCDGVGGVGPTRVWYLLRTRASEEEPTAKLPWVAVVANKVATAVAGAAGGATAAAAGAVGGAAVGGGDELRTLGRKA